MEKPASEYPTDQQIEESYRAYMENGRTGILEYLRERRRIREEADAANAKDSELVETLIETGRVDLLP
jgi:hypothetical protein